VAALAMQTDTVCHVAGKSGSTARSGTGQHTIRTSHVAALRHSMLTPCIGAASMHVLCCLSFGELAGLLIKQPNVHRTRCRRWQPVSPLCHIMPSSTSYYGCPFGSASTVQVNRSPNDYMNKPAHEGRHRSCKYVHYSSEPARGTTLCTCWRCR
jgi:hypothetical protein